jgi:hypothetical protein
MCCISDGERTHQRSTCELVVLGGDDAVRRFLKFFGVRLECGVGDGLL